MKKILTLVLPAIALCIACMAPASAQWSAVGSAGLSSSVANYTAITVNGSNVPYIAYKDNNKSDKLTVERFVSNSWSAVGTEGFSGGSVDYVDIAPWGNNIYVAYKDWNKSGKVTVKYYNGSAWSTIGSEGFSTGEVHYVSLAISSTGIPCVAYQDQSRGGRVTVKGFYSGSWTTLETEGFTNVGDHVDVAIDANDNLYVAYRDNSNSYKARVQKFDANSNSFSTLGSSSISAGGCEGVKLAVDGNGVVYISYKDWNSSSKLAVKKYVSGSWNSVGSSSGVSGGGINTPSIAIDGNNVPYVVYRDDNVNQKATVLSYSGGTWAALGGSAGFTSSVVDYTDIAIDNNNNVFICFKDNAVSQKATVMKHGAVSPTNTWTGATSTSWTTTTNWSANAVPTSSDNVKIPGSLSRYPNVTSGTVSCKSITINSGASVTINGGTIQIAGDIISNGTFTATNGTIIMNGTTAQDIPDDAFAGNTIKKLVLNNTAGCTLEGTLNITEEFTPTAGKLYTNDYLVLKSNSTTTARIGAGSASGNYIDGEVTVERYIPGGRRAFRFLAHPFGQAIKLSQLTDDIDITGPGGATNGFTPTSTNNSSAFWFDVTTADNSTAGNNPGWKTFTSANGLEWDPTELARILIRGTKGQGLTTTNYTPNAVTLDMKGLVNQGDKLIGRTKGNNSAFVIYGNPYAAPVNLKNVTRTNLISTFYIWNAQQGTKGGYTSYQFTNDYILPACGAFVTKISSGSTGYANFQESDKSTATPATMFKGTSANQDYVVEITMEDSTIFWDRILINFDSAATSLSDTFDMEKLNNPEIDFFTLSSDADSLSIDARPYQDSSVIKMGITYAAEKSYVFKVPQFNVPYGTKLYLYDKYLNKTEELKQGMEYWFNVIADTNSQGLDRFSINMVGKPIDTTTTNPPTQNPPASVAKVSAEVGSLQLVPNPAHNAVTVSFTKTEGTAVVRVTNLSGSVVYLQDVNTNVGSVTVPLTDLANGIYLVELQTAKGTLVEKLVKQ